MIFYRDTLQPVTDDIEACYECKRILYDKRRMIKDGEMLERLAKENKVKIFFENDIVTIIICGKYYYGDNIPLAIRNTYKLFLKESKI